MIVCKFRFLCDKTWDQLSEIEGQETVRFCGACVQPVFLCETYDEVQTHTANSRCVAVRADRSDSNESSKRHAPHYFLGDVEEYEELDGGFNYEPQHGS